MLVADSVVQGRYRIISQIGRGGMGTVYTARDENLGVLVALKQNLFDDQRLIEAFKREARLLAGLRHPTLPQVKDYFINESGQFLVMEYIAGDDFETILEKRRQKIEPTGEPKPFEVSEVVQWAEQLLDALDYLHTLPEPVIHRDIKPQNLKLAGRNQIILLDFGLAKGKPQWMTRVTTTGSIHGYTPNYAPMEQIRGVGTDPRSDLYALGATLYHLMTGTPPVDAATRADTVNGDEPDPLCAVNEVNPKVPYEVAAVLMKAMQQHRNKRPSTAAEMLGALRLAKHSTVIDRRSREAAPAADMKDVWPETEIKIRNQAEEEQKAQEEAERKRRAEQELLAREQAEAVRQQREREERERKERETAAALEARRVQEERERRAEALRLEKAQEEAEALRRHEDQSHRPLTKEPHVDEEEKAVRRKVMIAIGAGVVAVAILIWVIVALNKSDESLAKPQSPETAAPARLKAGVFTTRNKVSEVSFSADGRFLASVEEGSIVHLLVDKESTISVYSGMSLPGFGGSGKCVAISPDGKRVVSDGDNHSIFLWNANDLKGVYVFAGHSGMVFRLGFSPDGRTLFSASYDKTIKLWRMSDNWPPRRDELIKTVSTPEEGYAIVAISPDLRLVGFYNKEGSFKLWSLEQDDLIMMLDGDVPSVNCGAFSRDGQMLALGSSDGKVELWGVSDGRLMRSLGQFDADVMSVAISADSRVLAAGFKNGAIRLWRVSDGQSLTPLTGHTQSVNSLSFSGDGRTLASGSDDKTVRIWDVAEN